MLAYDFVLRAFAASGVVALVAGTVGYFMVLRAQTFAGHALSHIGFAGATGAALIGLPPLAGLVAVTVGAGAAMGFLGDRLSGRDVAIGLVLSLSLGFGLLFLSLPAAPATQVTALLFGNVLAVSPEVLATLVVLAVVTLAAVGVISRPLLFASLQPEVAEAKGVPIVLIGVAFLALVALAVAAAAQVVGVLLVFTLMVGPPAAAQRLTHRFVPGIALAALLGIAEAWLGIVLAWYTDWPTTFWIAMLSGTAYLGAVLLRRPT
jgi:zinc/manganese transport system permease protein